MNTKRIEAMKIAKRLVNDAYHAGQYNEYLHKNEGYIVLIHDTPKGDRVVADATVGGYIYCLGEWYDLDDVEIIARFSNWYPHDLEPLEAQERAEDAFRVMMHNERSNMFRAYKDVLAVLSELMGC